MSLDSHATRLDLLGRLKDLRAALPESSRHGICKHVLRIHPTSGNTEYDLIIALRELFGELGYDTVYPLTSKFVPGALLYSHTLNKWEGWQRGARIYLIDACIDYLEIRV